jgi:3-oxocholest-4-en-26-oyl-CoA dehydrogenase beta subunit
MDFNLTESQQAVAGLADQIFTGHLTSERFRALDAAPDRFDRQLWEALAQAGLLGISVPESYGGAGEGFLAAALLLEQAGRHAAPVPLLPTLVGAMAIARLGSDAQRAGLLPGVVDGSVIVTAALVEPGADPAAPGTIAQADGDGWRLDGSKTCVPAGTVAGRILVPARAGSGVGVFVVDPASPGVTVTPLQTTTGDPSARIELRGAAGEPLGLAEDGGDIIDWIVTHTTAGMCSQMAGAAKRSVELTAEYAKGREQFDRPIATFQAVGQRAAEAFIDAEGIQLTSRQAAWRLGEGLPSVQEVAIAKFWAADAGQRVVHAAIHLHGGVGVDRDYPLHRYFLLAKELELTLGGTTASLLRLGAVLASEPASV